jgi:molybdopterin-guanine dinucleotide biosynthesis protein A
MRLTSWFESQERQWWLAVGKTCGIILAGGQNRRMGQDKALLPYGGMTFLEHTVSMLLTMCSDIIVVADVPDKYELPCGQVVADIFPSSGPVGGILTGLTKAGDGWHYVVACDMPAIKRPVLELLRKAATADYDVVVPEVNNQLEPLCAVYRHTAVPKLLKFLERGGRAAQEGLKTLSVKRVGEGVLRRIDPEVSSFININTPEDLKAFEIFNRQNDLYLP